ncbi:helix-turn-helix domain-containing protein [Arenicella sp. 4NH20-0111]|uniref:AraC family transcriptional regulator n=1 Tax=Arenicella sp. 4NH20-0111 TaxID=3127648 RepID=UPI003102854E
MQIPNIEFDHSLCRFSDFEVLDIEDLSCRTLDHDPQRPHKVGFFQVIYFESGEGQHMIDFEDYGFSSGTVIFVFPEQIHAFDFSNKPKGKVLLFTHRFLDQVLHSTRLPDHSPFNLNHDRHPVVTTDKMSQARCNALIEQIDLETTHPNATPLIVMHLFSAILLLLHRLMPTRKNDHLSDDQRRTFNAFLKLLNTNPRQIREATWFANQVNTTYKTLNKICKLEAGMTAKQLIDSLAVMEIKRNLVIARVTIKRLAFDSGFEDVSNFIKYFKKHTGKTPSQFQKRHS